MEENKGTAYNPPDPLFDIMVEEEPKQSSNDQAQKPP